MTPDRPKRWPLILALVLLFLFSYANQLTFRYLVPPGGDAVNHNKLVLQILAGDYQAVLNYHFIWHFLVAGISQLTGTLTIVVMAWLAPLLLVSGGLMLYVFNRRFFGAVAGLTSLILIGFLSFQPMQTLYDGGFPNVLAAATVLPLVFIALEQALSGKRKWLSVPLFLVSLLVLLYSHHLTTLYALVIIAIYLIIQLLIYLNRRRFPWPLVLLVVPVLYGLFLLGVKLFLRLGGTSSEALAAQVVALNSRFPFLHFTGRLDNPNALLDIQSYPLAIGEAVVWLSVSGAVVALIYFIKDAVSQKGRISLLLLIWAAVLLWGSQTPGLGFPVRLARDLAIPLALLGGLFLQGVWDFSQARRLPKIFPWLIIILSLSLGWLVFSERWQLSRSPNSLVYHLPADTQMVDYINQNLPPQSFIAVFQDDVYLPLFVRDQRVSAEISDGVKMEITNPKKIAEFLPGADYIYFEYRPDRPDSWNNNRANLNSYLASDQVSLVTKVITDEKEVYLFKVVKPAAAREDS